MRHLVTGRAIITPSRSGRVRVRADGGVVVEDGRIVAVDGAERLRRAFPRARLSGGPEAIVLPGLINAHSHGMGIGNVELGTFDMPLELWNVMHLGRPKPERRAETALAALRQLRGGVTTTVHSQAGGNASDAAAILRGYRDAGIRTVLAVHARNQNRLAYERDAVFLARLPARVARTLRRAFPPLPPDYTRHYLEDFERLAASFEGPLTRLAYGPAGIQWVEPGLFAELVSRAGRERRLVHTHLLESPYERLYGPRQLGEATIPWLARQGLLAANVTGAHGVWVDPEDGEVLARHGVSLVHCPSSNLRLASGRMPLARLLEAGVGVALGTDSSALNDDDDFWTELRLAWHLHDEPGISGRRVSAEEAFLLATAGGARSIGRRDLGIVTTGARADLILLHGDAIDPRRALRGRELLEAVLARARPDHVALVMVEGQVVVERGRHVRLREATLRRRAWRTASHQPDLARVRAPLLRAVREFYGAWRLPERRVRRRPW